MFIIKNLALIVCTRNRPDEINTFFNSLSKLHSIPETIILVDSSELANIRDVNYFEHHPEIHFTKIRSRPGLPYQRSVGWETLKAMKTQDSLKCVSFLDDDCTVNSKFFCELEGWVSKNPKFIGVTGIPTEVQQERGKRIKKIFGLYTDESGKVLKSGIAKVPTKDGTTSWLPGLCMNINPTYLEIEKFKPDIRIYCEDLEMSLRLLKHGELRVNSEMKYTHFISDKNREKDHLVTKYTLGMNYWMGRNNYHPIKIPFVIWSAIGIALIDVLTFIINRNKLNRLRGSISFLVNVALCRDTVQRI